ncbi:MAG: excisionase family DNA-binding protein [Planctomycetaceae bacterium]|nr:excisionase family DNA-binding protein [Planctomycetaceae bacterium]
MSETTDKLDEVLYSPREVAIALGVSESSLKRWVDRGILEAQKTAGGHRRIRRQAVLQFVHSTGRSIVNPETLRMNSGWVPTSKTDGTFYERFLEALIAAERSRATEVLLAYRREGHSVAEMADHVIVPALHRIGELWDCGRVEIYEERRACEICEQVIHDLRRELQFEASGGPPAFGATLDDDPYTIAVGLAELVLLDNGWNAAALGNRLPFQTLCAAVSRHRPRLLWLSVSTIRDPEIFVAEMGRLYETTVSCGTALVVGGVALTSEIRPRLRYTTFCDTFAHLHAFASTIYRM